MVIEVEGSHGDDCEETIVKRTLVKDRVLICRMHRISSLTVL